MSLSIQNVWVACTMYTAGVPRRWHQTIEAHRRGVREAILETTAALVAEHGLHAVTMSQIAETAGIGRATLYKYFPDVEAILVAWHEAHVARHLAHLAQVREQAADPAEQLQAVLQSYAAIVHERARQHFGAELAAFVHRGQHLAQAQRQLTDFLTELLAEAVRAGAVRADVPADELASYCLAALGAASGLPSRAAVSRLVTLTLAGLRLSR
jgi:AcrR family transcriptional regulator